MTDRHVPLDVTRLQVGTELGPYALPPIDRATLALFAGASGDSNPIHIDIDAARAAGLEDVLAHGMLSMAYLARFVTSLSAQLFLRSFGVRFTAATPVHAQLTCRGTVTGVADDRVEVALTGVLADGTVTLDGYATFDVTGSPSITPPNTSATERGATR